MTRSSSGSSRDPTPATRYQVADLLIDLDRRSVNRGSERLDLPDLSYRLLTALVESAPDELGKDELVEAVWGRTVVSDETLAQRVRLLRQSLDDDSNEPRYVAVVRGRGYRLAAAARPLYADLESTGLRRKWMLIAAASAILLLVVGQLIPERPSQVHSAAPNTIAVLPFADLSPAGDHRHFADGMQEELLARLTRIDGVDVVSRTSVERFRETDLAIAVIGQELDARNIIEGSVRIAADRVRITVQLIDATADRHLWAENYERQLTVENVFAIQAEIANHIASTLELDGARVSGSEFPLPTRNTDAYELFLLGRYHTFRQTPGDLRRAVEYLERATVLDPGFAHAWATLGWSYSFLGTAYGQQPPRELYPLAREAALRALALDANLADARSLYADILTWYDWDFAAAELEYKKAIQIDPLNTLGYALFLSCQLRHVEAIDLVERRLAAQPLDSYVNINAAWRYLNARRYDKAIEFALRAGDHADANSVLGWANLAMRNINHAITYFERDIQKLGRRPSQLSNLASAYYQAGRIVAGDELLAEVESYALEQYVSPATISTMYFAAGNPDRGFALLTDTVMQRSREAIFMQVSISLDDYRDDERYLALVRKVGFAG